MDDTNQEQSTVVGAVQLPYNIAPYQPNQMMGTSAPVTAGQPASAGQVVPPGQPTAFPVAPVQLTPEQLSYQHIYQQHLKQLQQQLQIFWERQRQEIEDTTDFKNHSLPLARIKKIMKADEDVRMIAAEAPVLFARACEMFILELTLRAWAHTEENKRRTLQKNDIAAAITRTDVFDFLVDIVPRDEVKEDVLMSVPGVGGPNESIPYYYMPAPVAAPGMIVGRPAVDPALLYAQPPHAYMPHQVWPLQQEEQQQPTSDS